MKIETVELRNQLADEGNWLYREQEDGFRYFTKKVLLGRDAAPWPECTDAERLSWQQAWDASHPAEVEPTPDSEQPEPESEQPEEEQEGGEL